MGFANVWAGTLLTVTPQGGDASARSYGRKECVTTLVAAVRGAPHAAGELSCSHVLRHLITPGYSSTRIPVLEYSSKKKRNREKTRKIRVRGG